MLCGKSVEALCIGRLFCEYVVKKRLVEGVDYSCRHSSFLFGFLQADVMRPVGTNSNFEMTNNPLHKHTRTVDCKQEGKDEPMDPQISYADVYNTSDELITSSSEQVTSDISESLRISSIRYGGDDEKKQPIKEARLSYSSLYEIPADEMVIQKQFITSEILGSMRMKLQQASSDCTINDIEKKIEETSNYDDGMIASEGIVVYNKKKFKQGTRQSFINTLNRFQEKEALMGDNSSSLKNTIMLHSKWVKGNALLNSNMGARADPSSVLMTEETLTMMTTEEEGRTASLQNTMLLHSKSVKGNTLLKNKSNYKDLEPNLLALKPSTPE